MVAAVRSSARAGVVSGSLARAERPSVVDAALPGVPLAAAGEWVRLQLVLVELREAGGVTPCEADPELYFAGGAEAQGVAAEGCSWCPVLAACRAYAVVAGEGRHGGVWGGLVPPGRGGARGG